MDFLQNIFQIAYYYNPKNCLLNFIWDLRFLVQWNDSVSFLSTTVCCYVVFCRKQQRTARLLSTSLLFVFLWTGIPHLSHVSLRSLNNRQQWETRLWYKAVMEHVYNSLVQSLVRIMGDTFRSEKISTNCPLSLLSLSVYVFCIFIKCYLILKLLRYLILKTTKTLKL